MATGFLSVKDDYSPQPGSPDGEPDVVTSPGAVSAPGGFWVVDRWHILTRYAIWHPLGHVPSPDGTRVLIITYDEGDILYSRTLQDIQTFDPVLHALYPAGSTRIVGESGFVRDTVGEHQISAGTVADEFTFP